LGGDGGQCAQGERDDIAGDGTRGVGDDAAELVAGHGEGGGDTERCGGGACVT